MLMDFPSLMAAQGNTFGLMLLELMMVGEYIVLVMEPEVQHLLLLVTIIIVNQDVVIQIIMLHTTLMTHCGMGQDVSIATAVVFLTNHGSIVS